MKRIKLLALTAMTVGLTACGNNEQAEESTMQDTSAVVVDTTPNTASDTIKFKFDFAVANIPSPAAALTDLKNYGVDYDNSLLNSPSNLSKYASEHQKALNLGIYNIDMAYAMVYQKGSEVLEYMKPVMKMSESLGLKSAVQVMVGKRAEANLNNLDSLYAILDEIFVKSDAYLRNNDRIFTASTIFAGSWIETLYLNCRIAEKSSDPEKRAQARKHLWEQRFHLTNLMNVLNDFKDKPDCKTLMAELKPVQEQLQSIPSPEKLDDATFHQLTEKMMALRNRITG